MSENTATETLSQARQRAESLLPKDVVAYIHEVLQGDEPKSKLISVLHKLQREEGFLSVEQMDAVALLLSVPTSEVSGVATFYHFFQLNKPGENTISVCTGTACYVKGADKVIERFTEQLGIELGETTSDGQFSLAQARCLGMCGLAPVITINEEVYGSVTPDQVPALIEKYARKRS
jgi:NADH:ubiquinone oxidoreductase subunit E